MAELPESAGPCEGIGENGLGKTDGGDRLHDHWLRHHGAGFGARDPAIGTRGLTKIVIVFSGLTVSVCR